MSTSFWLLYIPIFFSLILLSLSKKVYQHQTSTLLTLTSSERIIIDPRPLRSEHFVYARCSFYYLNCNVVLHHLHRSALTNRTCVTSHKSLGTLDRDGSFQLKYLFGSSVAFVWGESGSDVGSRVRSLNMTDCSYRDVVIKGVTPGELKLVPYTETYDVFYRDDKMCGEEKACGLTIDRRGKVVNGPVPSWMRVGYFERGLNAVIGHVEHRSSRLGHFVLANGTRFVSAYGGRDVELMTDAANATYKAYSMENGRLGLCYISKPQKKLTCTQFNKRGQINMTYSHHLDYAPGPKMAIYNLPKGGILLATSQCDEMTWCRDNIDQVTFDLVKIQLDGTEEDVLSLKGVNCNGSDDVYMDVKGVARDNAGISVVCRVNKSPSEVFINLAHYYVFIQ